MSGALVLILGQNPHDALEWGVVRDGALIASGRLNDASSLDELAQFADGAAQIIAVMPGEHVAMRTLAAPPQAAAKFRAAASYLLEDELAEGLETLHVATGRRGDGAGVAMAIKASLMAAWREAFAVAGVEPDIIAPDFSLLPSKPDAAALIVEPVRIVAAIGDHGFAAERPLADNLILKLVSESEFGEIVGLGEAAAAGSELDGVVRTWIGDGDLDDRIRLFAEAAVGGKIVNLRQGDYRKRRNWGGTIGAWRRPAILAAASLLAFLGVIAADAARDSRIAAALREQTAEVHRSAFPDAANVNPQVHARRVLSERKDGPAFLAISTQFAESLAANDKIQVDRIRYNKARSEFSINLRFSDINDLETLKAALAARGVNAAEAGGVRRSGNVYVGELRVASS